MKNRRVNKGRRRRTWAFLLTLLLALLPTPVLASQRIIVAVLDSGVDATHPDLAGRVLPGRSFVPRVDDTHDRYGHGTHVAGIIAAGCDGCEILPVKVIDWGGNTYSGYIAQGIRYAVAEGASIINVSMTTSTDSNDLQDAVIHARNHGVIIVASVGNNGEYRKLYPACFPGVIGVGALDTNGYRASYSNWGCVDTWRLGTVRSTTPMGNFFLQEYSGTPSVYGVMSGTSMAAPQRVAEIARWVQPRAPLEVEVTRISPEPNGFAFSNSP
jgi:thermitase